MKSLEVKWLLGARADAEKPVEADLTPLRLAARFGNDEVVDAWLGNWARDRSFPAGGTTVTPNSVVNFVRESELPKMAEQFSFRIYNKLPRGEISRLSDRLTVMGFGVDKWLLTIAELERCSNLRTWLGITFLARKGVQKLFKL